MRPFGATAMDGFDGFLATYDEPRPPWIVDSQRDLRVGGTRDVVLHPPGVELTFELVDGWPDVFSLLAKTLEER
jgi:hypothetical protein